MHKTDRRLIGSVRHFALVSVFFFTGCSILSPQSTPEPPPEIVIVAPQAEPDAPAPASVFSPAQLPPVAIILSSNLAAYADVAAALSKQFKNHEIHDLSDSAQVPATVLSLINDSDTGVVVAIGLLAAKSSVALSRKTVVFSQVFNYQDHDLLVDNNRGVAVLAPLDAQLAAWKKIDPDISRIGAIVGPGHDELIAAAERAADRHDIDLRVQVTHSDQETRYYFKRMVRDIDGFWLFPDNRVLSQRALQEIMTDAQRQQVAVMVPNESMLQMGATISVSSVASDIANTITRIVRQVQAGKLDQIPLISPLSEIRVRTNSAVRVVDR